MRQITVISGKGGTGKTTIAAAFASLAVNAVFADCDVDAADLHLLLHPVVDEELPFRGLDLAAVDHAKCIGCGKCLEHCRFGAITEAFDVVREKCEGCGVCEFVCPAKAITMGERISGKSYKSTTRFGPMSHAALGIGEEASGLLVNLVRKSAVALAERDGRNLIIIDGPPGISCPVIASITGTDLVLVVTEPTVSGIHDMERVLGVAAHFGVKSAVCVNKSDINGEIAGEIAAKCEALGVPVVGMIKYDTSATEAMIAGKTLTEHSDTGIAADVRGMWLKLERMLAACSGLAPSREAP